MQCGCREGQLLRVGVAVISLLCQKRASECFRTTGDIVAMSKDRK